MKKLLFLSLITALISTTALAQNGPAMTTKPATPQFSKEQLATMLQEAKAKQVPLLVEKAGLTEAQAERVIEINLETRVQAATSLQGLNDADRTAKLAEIKTAKEKKYSEIPLTADQIKAVYTAYQQQ